MRRRRRRTQRAALVVLALSVCSRAATYKHGEDLVCVTDSRMLLGNTHTFSTTSGTVLAIETALKRDDSPSTLSTPRLLAAEGSPTNARILRSQYGSLSGVSDAEGWVNVSANRVAVVVDEAVAAGCWVCANS